MKKLIFLSIFCLGFASIYSQVGLKNTLSQRRHQVVCADYSHDGKYIVTGGLDNRIYIWYAESGTMYKELGRLRGFPLSVRFSNDGNYIVSGGKDNRVTVWDFHAGNELMSLRGHRGDVTSVAFSPDNNYIVSASHDRTVRIWRRSDSRLIHTLSGHRGEVMSAAFNPDGNKVISGSADGNLKEWDVANGSLIRSVNAHEGWVRAVAYSPNGNFIATGGDDYKINIWNAHNLELQNSIIAHEGWVETLDFSPDGRYLVSGGHDNYLIMIEVNSGRIVFNSEKQSYYVLSVSFNPNGKEFVSSTLYSKDVMVWNTEALGIKPPSEDVIAEDILKSRPKPVVEWITQDDITTSNLTFRANYRIRSGYPADHIVLYLNGQRYSSKEHVLFLPGEWFEDESVLYLDEGNNTAKLELYYRGGVVTSDILNIKYKPEVAEVVEEKVRVELVVHIDEEMIEKEVAEIEKALLKEAEEPLVTEEVEDIKPVEIAELFPEEEEAAEISEEVVELPEEDETAVVAKELAVTEKKPDPEELTLIPQPVTVDSELLDIPFVNPPNPYRFALIIGNEDYSSYQVGLQSESNVDYAIRDANVFREYAIKVFGVPEDNILFLTNARAIEMYNEIDKIKHIIRALNGRAEIIFYFAGHGFPDEQTREPHLMPVDVTGTNLRFAVRINDLYRELTEYPSERITVFLDACFSGGARNVGLVSARGVRVRPQDHLLHGNLVVFSASSDNQSAHPYRDKQHGIFTYFLLDKLRETEGNILYKDLSDYISTTIGVRSAIINNTEQTPQTNVSPAVEDQWLNWKIR